MSDFAKSINKSDIEVTAFLRMMTEIIFVQGEYDQGDHIVLNWDDAEDLLVIATTLWAERGVSE